MTKRDALIALLACTIGAGATVTVTGTSAAPAVEIHQVRLFRAQLPTDGGTTTGYALEVCGVASVTDGGDPLAQGCVSGPVPPARQAAADTWFQAAQAVWKAQKGVP